jgi:hypothetical protein
VYTVATGPGSYSRKYATLRISEDYARDKGHGRMEAPLPQPSQLAGMAFAQRAAETTGNQGLGLVIQSVMQPVLDELRQMRMERQAPAAPQQSMTDALAVIGTLNNQAQSQSHEMLKMMMAVMQGKNPVEAMDDDGQGDMISKATAGIGEGLGRALIGSFMQPPQAPAQAPRIAPQQMPQARPTLAPPPPTPNPRPEPMPTPAESPVPVEIRRALAPMAGELGRMFPMLQMFTAGMTPQDAAALLDDKVDSQEMAEALVILADQARQHGPEALRWIHPELATPHWYEVIKHLGAKIAANMLEAENDDQDAGNP